MTRTRKWLLPGIALGLGAPVLVVVGLSIALGLGFAFESGSLPSWIGGVSARWVVGFCLALAAQWLLVRACVRAGGKRAWWSGVAIYVALAGVLALLSPYLQSQQSENPAAGFGFAMFAIFLGVFLVPLLVMGIVALRLSKRRPKAGHGRRR